MQNVPGQNVNFDMNAHTKSYKTDIFWNIYLNTQKIRFYIVNILEKMHL
jgi:hypothetical protein